MPNPFGPLYSIEFVACVLCAIAWYKAAEVEGIAPWLWVGMSVAVYVLTWRYLGWGFFGNLFGQILLVAGITGVRAWRSSRQ
jgi:hypothetical protein